MGCHALLQGIFPTQGLNPRLLCLCIGRRILYTSATWEALLMLLVCCISKEVKHGGNSLSRATPLSSSGFTVSGCRMRWLVRWCQGSLWVQSNQDSFSVYLFLTPVRIAWFQRRAYCVHVSKNTLPLYIFECSMKPNFCPVAHYLFYFPLFSSLSLSLPLFWSLVWESNNLQNSSQILNCTLIELDIFK